MLFRSSATGLTVSQPASFINHPLGVVNATLSGHAVNLGQANSLYVAQNAAITGATKTKITYDAKGLVTAGADLTASDIPNLDASKITSGTLGVALGGTGAISFTSGNVLVGAGTSAVTTLSRSGIDTRTIFPTDATTHNHDSVYGRLASANTWTQINYFQKKKLKLLSKSLENINFLLLQVLFSKWKILNKKNCLLKQKLL